MSKHSFTEAAEVHGRQGRIERADEIFVKPLCFFKMEAYSASIRQVLQGKILYKSRAQVVQP